MFACLGYDAGRGWILEAIQPLTGIHPRCSVKHQSRVLKPCGVLRPAYSDSIIVVFQSFEVDMFVHFVFYEALSLRTCHAPPRP